MAVSQATRTGCLIVPFAVLIGFVVLAGLAAALGAGAGASGWWGVVGAVLAALLTGWGIGRGAFTSDE